jgi:transcriptional regulator with XRE-family HTH domain
MSSLFVNPISDISARVSIVSQETFDDALGRNLASRRHELGISQDYLSSILRRDQTFVSKLETGKRSITLFEFLRWSRALNLGLPETMEILSQLESHVE